MIYNMAWIPSSKPASRWVGIYLRGYSVVGVRDGIYLSGWEYNRLLQRDPIARRNSALPAEILWNGAAPLWLFRNVFCTQEGIDNEWRAYELLGWPTGRIFTELCNRDIITPLDWADLSRATQVLVRQKHVELLRDHVDEARIRNLISAGATGELDTLKNSLIAPIADANKCVLAVTPNSLRHWIRPPQIDVSSPTDTVLKEIATRVPSGLVLCSSPGTGLGAELRVQRQVEMEHQAPMIPELLAGDGRFSGPTGYEDYLRQLMPFKAAFDPINQQLLSEWQRNHENLFRLRDAAERHLWPFLHGEWIPALESGEASAEQFIRLLEQGLKHRRISPFLSQRARIAMVVSATGAGGVASAMQALAGSSLGGMPGAVVAGIAAGTAAGVGLATSELATGIVQKYHKRHREADHLTMFYQKAEKIVS
jgi:hypothetical protein